MTRLPLASLLLLLASPSLAAPQPPKLPAPPLPPAPFSPAELKQAEECLRKLGAASARDGDQLTRRLISDTGGYLKDSSLEVMAALRVEVGALFDEAIKSDPSASDKLIDSALHRLESQYDRVPAVKCLKPCWCRRCRRRGPRSTSCRGWCSRRSATPGRAPSSRS